MYPFCFLGAQDDDGGCPRSAEAGEVGQGKEKKIHLINNKFCVYFLQIPVKHDIIKPKKEA